MQTHPKISIVIALFSLRELKPTDTEPRNRFDENVIAAHAESSSEAQTYWVEHQIIVYGAGWGRSHRLYRAPVKHVSASEANTAYRVISYPVGAGAAQALIQESSWRGDQQREPVR